MEDGELIVDIGPMRSMEMGSSKVVEANYFNGALRDQDDGFQTVHHRKGKKKLLGGIRLSLVP